MINKLIEALSQVKAQVSILDKEVVTLQSQLEANNAELDILMQCNAFLSAQIDILVESKKAQLESLVNQGLEYVFGSDELYIKIHTIFKNNKPQYQIRIFKGAHEGLAESFGGGVLSTISILLRIGLVIVKGNERFVFLDESLSFLSVEYQGILGNFLQKLAKELDFTIILVSHQDAINQYANITYQAQIQDGAVAFKKVTNAI